MFLNSSQMFHYMFIVSYICVISFWIILFLQVKELAENSTSVLQSTEDCFGHPLLEDEVLGALQGGIEEDVVQFKGTMDALLKGSVSVLERQLSEYLTGSLSSPTPEQLKDAKPAPAHNMESERILALTDSQWRRAPNATMGFIDSKVRGKKNNTLESLRCKSFDEQDQLISFAVTKARKFRALRKKREEDMREIYQRRMKQKMLTKDKQLRGKVGKKIEAAISNVPANFTEDLSSLLPHIDISMCEAIIPFVQDPGVLVGQNIHHIWDVDAEDILYAGNIIEIKQPKNKPAKVRVAYWLPELNENEAEDTNIKLSELLTDFLLGDMTFDVIDDDDWLYLDQMWYNSISWHIIL